MKTFVVTCFIRLLDSIRVNNDFVATTTSTFRSGMSAVAAAVVHRRR